MTLKLFLLLICTFSFFSKPLFSNEKNFTSHRNTKKLIEKILPKIEKKYEEQGIFPGVIECRNGKKLSRPEEVFNILNYHEVDNPNEKIVEIACDLYFLYFYFRYRLIDYLTENMSADHPDPEVRQMYKIFFSKQGLPKLIPVPALNFSFLTLPETIHNKNHIQDRISLYQLAIATPKDDKNPEIVRKGINYIIESCNEGPLWQTYSNIGKYVAEALCYVDSNKIILSTMDFTAPYEDFELKNKVILFVAFLADRLQFANGPNSKNYKDFFKSLLKLIDLIWQEVIKTNHPDSIELIKSIVEGPIFKLSEVL